MCTESPKCRYRGKQTEPIEILLSPYKSRYFVSPLTEQVAALLLMNPRWRSVFTRFSFVQIYA
jgi:hypothetical protein